jgi:glyoxylase-like metal-dependent hydrolase (beta-lactamase superfamily II)
MINLQEHGMVYFRQILVGNMSNFSYLFGCEKAKVAAVVDPAFEVDRIKKQAVSDGFSIKYIFTTHTHFDHIGGHMDMIKKTGAKVIAHRLASSPLEKNHIPLDISVEDNDEVRVGDVQVRIIHTPGHTPEGICLLIEGRKLVTGDTLFVGDCGRTDLPGGSSKDLFSSIQKKLKTLDASVEVYPGHDYGEKPFSTIGEENKNNPAMNCKSFEEFDTLP